MVFCSAIFLFLFLPICLLVYHISPKAIKNSVLLLFSFIFYAWGETTFLWLIISSILLNYALGLLIHYQNKKLLLLWIGVSINLLALVYYKYSGFIFTNIGFLESTFQNSILPLGISFYTFHSISYLVDIYRKKVEPQKNIIKMSLYIVNFPQLVAGPIIRYHDINKQLSERKIPWNKISNGIKLFIFGLSKKMIIANNVGLMADTIFNGPLNTYSIYYCWLGVLSYMIQIYFDFSGYSDMAIGLGKMFGFDFKPNFNFPYSATSMRSFWQKWHISLSSWFRDYLYIPLGGNKNGNFRTYFNLLIVFLLCGFWHGANFTFIVWGLLHGLFLIIERLTENKISLRIPNLIKHLYVWLVLLITWVFFRSDNVNDGFQIIKKMFTFNNNITTFPDVKSHLTPYFIILICIGVILSTTIWKKKCIKTLKNRLISFNLFRVIESGVLVLLLIMSILEIISNSYNPFIYYRF